MTRKIFFVGTLVIVMVILAACGTPAKPAYNADAIVAQAQETVTAHEEATQEVTQEATEMATEAAVQEATQETTEMVTEVATQEATEMATVEATQETTEMATVGATQETTEMVTEVATQEATEMATVEATQETTQEATAEVAQGPIAPEDDPLYAAVSAADATTGQQLFASNGCVGCHSTDPSGMTIVGPGQWGVLERAETRIPGMGPYSYIFDSIVNPNDYVVDGFPANTMPQNFRDLLTDDQIYDIIAYLITLHD